MGTRAKAVREKLMNICQERPQVALPRKFINQRYAEGGNAHTHFEKIVHMHESSLSRCDGQNQYVDLLLASIPSSHHPAVRKKGGIRGADAHALKFGDLKAKKSAAATDIEG